MTFLPHKIKELESGCSKFLSYYKLRRNYNHSQHKNGKESKLSFYHIIIVEGSFDIAHKTFEKSDTLRQIKGLFFRRKCIHSSKIYIPL